MDADYEVKDLHSSTNEVNAEIIFNTILLQRTFIHHG